LLLIIVSLYLNLVYFSLIIEIEINSQKPNEYFIFDSGNQTGLPPRYLNENYALNKSHSFMQLYLTYFSYYGNLKMVLIYKNNIFED
jgi:hypothetical protein